MRSLVVVLALATVAAAQPLPVAPSAPAGAKAPVPVVVWAVGGGDAAAAAAPGEVVGPVAAGVRLGEADRPSVDDVLRPAVWLGRRMVVVGFVCGVAYAVGGLVVDALTTGLNEGTALAFGAVVGMPVLFGAAGFVAGGLAGATVVVVRVAVGG